MRYKQRYIVGMTALLLGSAMIGFSNPESLVRADDDPVSTTQKALQENQDQASDLQEQVQTQEDKITDLNNQISNKTLDIEKSEQQIKIGQQKLKKVTRKVTETKADVKTRKKAMQDRLVSLQKQTEKSTLGNVYADFVFSGNDLTDVLSRAIAVKKISNTNKLALQTLQSTQTELTTLMHTKQTQQTKLVDAKDQLEADKEKLDEDKATASDQQAQLTSQLTANQSANTDLQEKLKSAQEAQKAIEVANQAEKDRQAQATEAAPVTVAGSNNTVGTAGTTTIDRGAYQQAISSVLTDGAAKNKIIQDALQYLGVPYVWGGTTPAGFDCSGLIYYCYKLEGRTIPRVSQGQSTQGQYVNIGELQPGDLVFWGGVGTAHHVGLYIGNGQYIHAPQPGETVKIGSIAYYRPDFGRRL